ncbi:hypothetical protein [Paenibacillus sp. YN15]|uniref:hypothetical protein n=1 Tax=Paenibacillus sp. YN15 TaxID=1742774 RepID=UPI000DCC9DDD|nr:hypothetical protein [Paenibacillus sp. YN15]RAV04664.1 hypothetical protein DQG13_05475 [Paenibacillus sp. YN15]
MENKTKFNNISKTGFWAPLFSVLFYLAFDIAAILNMSGILASQFWISILYYTPSIFLALSFVVMMVSIHHYAPPDSKIYSHIGVTLASIYATINCFIYIIQVLIIAPTIVGVLIWPPLFYISASVGIIYPLAAVLIAVLFRRNSARLYSFCPPDHPT